MGQYSDAFGTHGFVATPITGVPEPYSLTLLGSGVGLAGFIIMRRRATAPSPRLQLHRYDSPRLCPVGKGVVDDASSDRGTSADADTDRRFRAVYPHIRRSGDSGCPAQRRINRRRHFRNSATVILAHCPPSARAK